MTAFMKANSSASNQNAAQNAQQSTTSLPAFFEPLLVEQYGPMLAACVISGCDARRASSLRANALLSTRDEVAAELDAAGMPWRSVAWYEDAFVIDAENAAAAAKEASARAENAAATTERGENPTKSLWDLPLYDKGKIYLQSLSSMLPPLVLGAQPGLDILDMCAAPGGKTTQLAALGGKGTHITACEMHAPRAEKLEYNLRKQGANNVMVMRTDARQLDEFFRFDRILVDAPCSGSGTLRTRDPKLHTRFTQKLIQKSCKAQRALLDKALSLLKPGGTLVYSTCSVLTCENEEIVRAALKQANKRGLYELEPVELPSALYAPADELGDAESNPDVLPVLPTTIEGALCVCPTRLYEGFFVTKVKRVR